MNEIEYRSIRACSGDRMIRVLTFRHFMGRRRDIGADLELSQRKMKTFNLLVTL